MALNVTVRTPNASGSVFETQLDLLGFGTVLRSAGTVAAAGSLQTDATAIAHDCENVTAADGTKGVILPIGLTGMMIFVKNADAANAVLKVWPGTAGTINALGANNSISMAAKTGAVFMCTAPNTWFTIPLLPS